MRPSKINESEKQRIIKLHKDYSIKEAEGGQEDIDVDIFKSQDILGGPVEPKAKMGAACGELHIFVNCPGGQPLVPTASNIPYGAPCAQISSGSIPFYSMVGSPSPGQVVFVTAYGGGSGGEFCLKYIGIKDHMTGLTHAPLDLGGSPVQFIQSFPNCPDCVDQKRDYDCQQDGAVYFCQDVNWGTGQFSGPTALADCQANCGTGTKTEHCMCCDSGGMPVSMATPVPVGTCNSANFGPSFTNCVPASGPMPNCGGAQDHCVNCNAGWMMPIPQGQQCPQGSVNIGTTPNPPGGGPCWECVNQSVCQQTSQGWNFGPNSETTQALCMALPQCGNTNFACQGGQCVPDPNGAFNSMADCQANCPPWKCTAGPQGCIQHNSGTYADQASCETACCQANINNWNWQFLPNPTCQQVCAKLNTPALLAVANNTSTNFIHKCRYDWLVAQGCNCLGVSDACCDNTGYLSALLNPVPGPNSGKCIKQQFITMCENGYNQYGCQWLQNLMQNIDDALIQHAGNNAYECSLTGRKVWLTTFMNGGSAYATSVVVNPPC